MRSEYQLPAMNEPVRGGGGQEVWRHEQDPGRGQGRRIRENDFLFRGTRTRNRSIAHKWDAAFPGEVANRTFFRFRRGRVSGTRRHLACPGCDANPTPTARLPMRPLHTLTLAGALIAITGATLNAQTPGKGKQRPPVDDPKANLKGIPPVIGPVAPATGAPIKDRLAKVAALVNDRKFKEYTAEDQVLGLDLLQADPEKLLAELNAAIRAVSNDPYLYKTRALLIFAIIFALVGLSAIVIGAINGEGVVSISGAVASVRFWPAVHYSAATRRANIRLRLLEFTLSRAQTAEAGERLIREAFPGTDVPVEPPKGNP
jgi:hypothetical protein